MLRYLGSLKLAIALIVVLGVVLAAATFLEASKGPDYGTEYVQWYVYHSRWFAALLALLGVNIVAATVVRWPWKRRLGYLITHAGLLALLLGALQTFIDAGNLPGPLPRLLAWAFPGSLDGHLVLKEGERQGRVALSARSQVKVEWSAHPGKEAPASVGLSFQPGPVDWPAGKTLDLGDSGPVRFRILKYYRAAEAHDDWVADESGQAGPALNLVVVGPDDHQVAADWLTFGSFGVPLTLGSTSCQLYRAVADSMRDDFLNPPGKETDPQGVLSIHYQGHMIRVPVSKNVGKRVAVGESHVELEIVKYYANARPTADVHFVSDGDRPDNPLLELRIHLPDGKPPLREIALAKAPGLNLADMHDRPCPLKFWYHHPAVTAQADVEFLQTPDGKLACRTGVAGKYQPRPDVAEGDRIPIADGYKVKLARYLPSGRREVWFQSLPAADESPRAEAAIQLEVEYRDQTQRIWLPRHDAEHGAQMDTPDAHLTVSFDYDQRLLDFDLKLLKFTEGTNPGGMGDSSFTSRVEVLDPHGPHGGTLFDKDLPAGQADIYMNHPLKYNHLVFSQASFDPAPDGKWISVIGVTSDPGELLKYAGSLLICVGVFWMFYAKEFTRKFA